MRNCNYQSQSRQWSPGQAAAKGARASRAMARPTRARAAILIACMLALGPACDAVDGSSTGRTGETAQAYQFAPQPHLQPVEVQSQMTRSPLPSMVNKGFGAAVAVSGERLVVGVPGDSSNKGAAFVQQYNGTAWTSVQLVVPSPGLPSKAGYGAAVAISEDANTVVVGAPCDGSTSCQGAAYIFRHAHGTVWHMIKKLSSGAAGSQDRFGASVSVTLDQSYLGRVAVGAPNTVVSGTTSAGAVYVFDQISSWGGSKLVAPSVTSGQWFGTSVAAAGHNLAVGAPGNDRAYVFDHNGSSWVSQQTLIGGSSSPNTAFGSSVDIAEDRATVVVGAPNQGAAYVFQRDGASWTNSGVTRTLLLGLADKFSASDKFGAAVAIGTNDLGRQTVVVGAPHYTGGGGVKRGAMYIFVRPAEDWVGRVLTDEKHVLLSSAYIHNHFGASVAIGHHGPAGDCAVGGAPNKEGLVQIALLNINRRSHLVNYLSFDQPGMSDPISGRPTYFGPGVSHSAGAGCKDGGCIELNGSTDVVFPSDIPMFDENRTVMMWFKDKRATSTLPMDGVLFSYGVPRHPLATGKMSGFAMLLKDDKLRFTANNNTSNDTHSHAAGKITVGGLHHGAVTYHQDPGPHGGAVAWPYLDGIRDAKGNTLLSTSPHADLTLGASPFILTPFKGYIDEVKIYDVALSKAAIKAISSN